MVGSMKFCTVCVPFLVGIGDYRSLYYFTAQSFALLRSGGEHGLVNGAPTPVHRAT